MLSQAVTWLYEHSQGKSWKSIASQFALHHGTFLNNARSVQTQVYNDAQNVLGQLNDTIDTAASGYASVIDTSDFTGHDMCAKTGQWVFAPDVTLQLTFLGHTYHKTLGGEVCPDPVNESPIVDKTIKFTGGKLKIDVNENCGLPIPPPTGRRPSLTTSISKDDGRPGGHLEWPSGPLADQG